MTKNPTVGTEWIAKVDSPRQADVLKGDRVTVSRVDAKYVYYTSGTEKEWVCKPEHWDESFSTVINDITKEIVSDGGPAQYYDFPEGAITLNDLIEYKDMGFHLGNIFKACWRYGTKKGTSKEYDARKIIYSGARLLMGLVGVKELRITLQKMLDDPQFQERN